MEVSLLGEDKKTLMCFEHPIQKALFKKRRSFWGSKDVYEQVRHVSFKATENCIVFWIRVFNKDLLIDRACHPENLSSPLPINKGDSPSAFSIVIALSKGEGDDLSDSILA